MGKVVKRKHINTQSLKVRKDDCISRKGKREIIEDDAINEWLRKYISKFLATRFSLNENNGIQLSNEKKEILEFVRLFKSTGCAHPGLGLVLLEQLAQTYQSEDDLRNINNCTEIMNGISPNNEMEGILASQMAGTHNLAMEFMRRAVLNDQTLEGIEIYANRAIRLMALFNSQIEILEKLRGKNGCQKVTVEHVHVSAGGQAIVGNVEAVPRGEGDQKKEQG